MERTITELNDRNVALLGFGTENRALLPWLLEQGATVTICDKNEALEPVAGVVDYHFGPDYLQNLNHFEVIVRTPGLPYLSREIQDARQAGVVVTSQTKLFLERCSANIIGVTGTKGKGTTSSLINEILTIAHQSGEIAGQSFIAGNIGTPPIQMLDQLTQDDWVVLELSSFQLQDVTISPHIAVVLNVTVDHLDHHRDEAEYISAKKNIVRYQTPEDYVVINQDSLTSVLFADETPAKIYFFSRSQSVDQGSFVEQRAGESRVVLRLPDKDEAEVCRADEVKLVGTYNLENITAATTAAALAGASLVSIKKGVTVFAGLSHRLQYVGTKKQVRYYDDSKATTPDSTAAAVLSFSEPIVLIVGGSSKGADFTDLIETIRTSSVTHIICIGQEGERLQELLTEAVVPQQLVAGGSTMTEIVHQAAALAQPGGIVLLSPAAASFDMFKNAEDRGEQFQAAVRELPE